MDPKFSVHLNNVPCFDISHSSHIVNINQLSINSIYKPLDFSNISYYYPTIDLFLNHSFNSQQNLSLDTNRQILNHNSVIENNVSQSDVNIVINKCASDR